MRVLMNLSIKRKLILIITLTSTFTLLLACAAFLSYELITFRYAVTSDLSALAKVVADSSTAAVAFGDQATAEETVMALRAKPHIVAACIYTADGELLAQYVRKDFSKNFKAPKPRADYHEFVDQRLDLFRRIILDGKTIGFVYVSSDMQEMQSRVKRYAGIVCLVLLTSSFIAFLISSKAQRVISEPILHLVKTARTVSSQKDYSIRAKKDLQR